MITARTSSHRDCGRLTTQATPGSHAKAEAWRLEKHSACLNPFDDRIALPGLLSIPLYPVGSLVRMISRIDRLFHRGLEGFILPCHNQELG